MSQLNTFSFRAECLHDIILMAANVSGSELGKPIILTVTNEDGSDTLASFKIKKLDDTGIDCAAEFQTNLSEDKIREHLDRQVDSHVIEETLRPVPLSENSLERVRR